MMITNERIRVDVYEGPDTNQYIESVLFSPTLRNHNISTLVIFYQLIMKAKKAMQLHIQVFGSNNKFPTKLLSVSSSSGNLPSRH